MKLRHALLAFATGLVLSVGQASAVELAIVSGAVGNDLQILRDQLDKYEQKSGNKVSIVSMPPSTTDQFGQYKLWLAAQNADIDVYRTDVIWAPQLANQLVDLTEATKDVAKDHFPAIIESQTVNGKLVALPMFTDAPALYYRKDLLDKYGAKVPTSWKEMADTAKMIMDKERAAGNKDIWGFVFQGNAYEGLTCDALEWVKSNGGGQIVEPDGSISINNPKAAEAIDMVKGWVGTISPPGVLAYQEEDSRGVWQQGNAVFMRNWPYAYSLGNSAELADQGQVRRDHAPHRSFRRALGGDPRWLESRGVQVFQEPRGGDRPGQVPRLRRGPEGQCPSRLEAAHHPGPLRRRRHQGAAADHPALEGGLPQRRAAAFGPDAAQVQRGFDRVLERGARDARRQRLGCRQPQEARRQAEAPEGRRLVGAGRFLD